MPQQLVKTPDNKFYAVEPCGNFLRCAAVTVAEVAKPCHRWQGYRVPVSSGMWKTTLAFLEWSYQETKGETVVHWYYHETEGWYAVVFPQEGYTGMTIKAFKFEDTPQIRATLDHLPKVEEGEWVLMGTVHHHCSSGAFQSGGDEQDEKTKVGLHITVGGMGSAKYSIHGRVSLGQEITPCIWADWFGLDPAVEDVLKSMPEVYDKILEEQLKLPADKDCAFPDWWKANVIKVERSFGPYTSGAWQNGSFQTSQSQVKDAKRWAPSYYSKVETTVQEICQLGSLTLEDFLLHMEKLEGAPWHLIIDGLSEAYAEPSDFVAAAEDMIRERNAKDDKEFDEMDAQIEKMEALEAYKDGELLIEDKTSDQKLDERIGLAKSAVQKGVWVKNADGTETLHYPTAKGIVDRVAAGLDPKDELAPQSDEDWAIHFGVDY